MTLLELTNAANAFTDENFDRAITIYFANEAIATINTRLNASLPAFELTADYTALSDDWLRLLVVPYISYSIKRNDGSIAEADRFFQNFLIGLAELESKKFVSIPEAFRSEDFGSTYIISTEDAINVGWFLNRETDQFPWEK